MPEPDGPTTRTPVRRATEGPTRIAVVDLDGVLADVRHRLHHVERHPKDWATFFALAESDPPLAEGFAVARELAERHQVVYLSGRPERCRTATERWLTRHDAPVGQLILRRDGDRRPARRTKLGELSRLASRHEVVVLVDVDPAVCAAARDAGFPVFEATWGRDDGADSQARSRTLFDAQENDGRT
jgi:hypothetical protein